MRSWLAEVLRVTANHLSPIKPVVIKQDVRVSMPGVNEAMSASVRQMQDAMRFTGR